MIMGDLFLLCKWSLCIVFCMMDWTIGVQVIEVMNLFALYCHMLETRPCLVSMINEISLSPQVHFLEVL